MGVREGRNEKRKLGLTTIIFIALLLGAITGLILHYWVPEGFVRDTVLINGVFYVFGNGFLRGMRMLVVPLVFCSLVCGAMSIGDTKKLGKVGVKTILFYLATTALAITVALGVGILINPGRNLDMSAITIAETTIQESQPFVDVILDIIPINPIQSLAEGNMLQIIVFALIIGIILAKQGEKASTVANFISQGNNIMMDMTLIVMKVAPIGVFCLIAKTFAAIGFDGFAPMLKYMGSVLFALGLQCFVVYLLMLKGLTGLSPIKFVKKFAPVMGFAFSGLTGLSPIKFVKKFAPVMGFAFSTATSNATIPLSIETLHKKLGVSKKISSFTIPLGATINMDGTAIMQGVAVVFVAQAFNITLTSADYLTVIATATIASIGTAGVPGVGLITLSMVFASVGLPVEGIGIIMGIDRLLDMARTAVNITGDAVCTTIVAYQDELVDVATFNMDESKLEVES